MWGRKYPRRKHRRILLTVSVWDGRSDTISFEEFKYGLQLSGIRPVPEAALLKELFTSFDRNNSGRLEFGEVISALEGEFRDSRVLQQPRFTTSTGRHTGMDCSTKNDHNASDEPRSPEADKWGHLAYGKVNPMAFEPWDPSEGDAFEREVAGVEVVDVNVARRELARMEDFVKQQEEKASCQVPSPSDTYLAKLARLEDSSSSIISFDHNTEVLVVNLSPRRVEPAEVGRQGGRCTLSESRIEDVENTVMDESSHNVSQGHLGMQLHHLAETATTMLPLADTRVHEFSPHE